MPAHLRREGTAGGLTPHSEGFCKMPCVSLCCPQSPCSRDTLGTLPWGPCTGLSGIELPRLCHCPQPLPRAARLWEQPPQLLQLQGCKEVRSDRVGQISGHPKNNNHPPFSLAALPHTHLPCLNWKIESLLRSAGRFS